METQQEETTLQPQDQQPAPKVRSLQELVDSICGRNIAGVETAGDAGIAERLPFPFLGLVGQWEMKLALMLAIINPALGGILLIGPRGTGKTTAVRSLLDLLPQIETSKCFYGCLPEDIESGGIDAVCPDCARKYGHGEPLTGIDRVKLVELPLNATLDDVIGGLDDRALIHERLRLKRGILAQSDRNILYVDEVNLLDDTIVDAILDASAQGMYTVRRGPIASTYRARFTLVGSMNPEEGNLRSQILDRFSLRVVTRGLEDASERLEAYRRVKAYLSNNRKMIAQYAEETAQVRDELQAARRRLPEVALPDPIAQKGIDLIKRLEIDSLRAEVTLFEAARAYAAADGRSTVEMADMRAVAPMSLRLRRSQFMAQYFSEQAEEERELTNLLEQTLPDV